MTAPTDMNDWNRKIIEEFRANEVRVGGPFEGAPMMLVHHTGAPTDPDCHHNLKAHPSTTVEIGTETIPVEATEVTGPEREEVWAKAVAQSPGFGEYREKTTRVIPVIRLTRTS